METLQISAKHQINIAEDFSTTPGARYTTDGQFSGQEFYNTHLKPSFEEALDDNDILTINFNNVEGYATSFLEEAFGGLAREFGINAVLAHLKFISNDDPYLENEVKGYIRECHGEKE